MNNFDLGRWMKTDRGSKDEPRSGEAEGWTWDYYMYEYTETVVNGIEAGLIDLTKDYNQWLNIGYALAAGLGENGRIYFHRISQYNPLYTFDKAEAMYEKCMKAKREGITMSNFFDLAAKAGVSLKLEKDDKPTKPTKPTGVVATDDTGYDPVSEMSVLSENGPLETFSNLIEDSLPPFLKIIAGNGESYQEKDLLILGSIVTISSCLPNRYGRYAGMEVYPNLFFFLTARASSGKGRLNLCRLLVQPIHDRMFEQYKKERKEYLKLKAEYETRKTRGMQKPDAPAKRMLFIPANSSATSVYQILSESDERGLIFETEGDTLAYSFASDFGNFSDGFRKAFHHEPISYHRRKDDEHVDIMHPQLSTVLSGTPEQLRSLIKDTENGLFSRFIFYRLNSGLDWMDVFADPLGKSLDAEFSEYGRIFTAFHDRLCKTRRLYFQLKETQTEKFNRYFSALQVALYSKYGEDMIPSVRRMGLIFYRIAMILTTLRIMTHGDYLSDMLCMDMDFEAALRMVNVIMQHTVAVYKDLCQMKGQAIEERISMRAQFLNEMPDEFTWSMVFEKALEMKMCTRTAERYVAHYLKNGMLEKESSGTYRKVKKET